VAALRATGVRVVTGVLGEACREHHRGFLSVHERGRPFVTLKLAATLDGRIATARGESRWISSPRARELVQRWRAGSDAILVGSGTVLADDPELAARRRGRIVRRPVRIVVDSALRVPTGARVVREAHLAPTWLLCAPRPPARRRAALEARGVRVVPVARRGARLDLRRALVALAREGITSVLCEGGAGLAAALLREGLADELHWFVSPKLLGADARPALGPLAVRRLAEAIAPERVAVARVGPDLHVHARFDSAKLRA
jgi:diaminohydroxyphosphoribosylaminopyrimidine deaminase/5-amino-6-(5-phosphoribosylamino)uracil reductase